jgi:hypothetical protein
MKFPEHSGYFPGESQNIADGNTCDSTSYGACGGNFEEATGISWLTEKLQRQFQEGFLRV